MQGLYPVDGFEKKQEAVDPPHGHGQPIKLFKTLPPRDLTDAVFLWIPGVFWFCRRIEKRIELLQELQRVRPRESDPDQLKCRVQ